MLKRAIFAIAFLVAAPTRADLSDYERARLALDRHEVLPLAELLPVVERETGARMIEVEFEEQDGKYIYEFELIAADGRLLEAVVDAASGRILTVGEDRD